MRVIAFIDNSGVVEKILRHLTLWCGPAGFAPALPPPDSDLETTEPDFRIEFEPMPDYENVITD